MRSKKPLNIGNLLQSITSSTSSTSNTTNGTSSGFEGLSVTTLLESFVPGYGPVHNLVLQTFGFDVTILVSLIVALYIAQRLFQSTFQTLYSSLSTYWMSEINISSTDEIHTHLISFLAHKNETTTSRRLIAETASKTSWELDQEDTEHESLVDADGNIKWLNFANQEAKSQPRFTPAMGSHNFWHNGTYFILKRKQQIMFEEGRNTMRDTELLTISCFGRSTDPIKQLIDHAKTEYYKGFNKKTIIRRPAGSERRRLGNRGGWVKISERPCRPLNTVVLDEAKKMEVLKDINEYLSPATARWYANRGIPYRRGYLLYGPPGTGKTSLTFALAGVFGLDIHVVSLLDPTLTEEELGNLFATLPGRCIVLLEDIDTAGLVKRELGPIPISSDAFAGRRDGRGVRGKGGEGEGKSEGLNMEDLAMALKRSNQMSEEEKKKGITLSGLLNIIDGVASHEGRVLIMTTNKPESLDAALIRPGRVDHQVGFTNATTSQIAQLFERMYTNDVGASRITGLSPSSPPPAPTSDVSVSASANGTVNEKPISHAYDEKKPGGMDTPPPTPRPISTISSHNSETQDPATSNSDIPYKPKPETEQEEELTPTQLSSLAQEFASAIPEGIFSPAEIQGFLLKRKKEPRKAVLEVGEWVREMEERRRRGGGGFGYGVGFGDVGADGPDGLSERA